MGNIGSAHRHKIIIIEWFTDLLLRSHYICNCMVIDSLPLFIMLNYHLSLSVYHTFNITLDAHCNFLLVCEHLECLWFKTLLFIVIYFDTHFENFMKLAKVSLGKVY